jgi:hypothetical protein
MPSSSSEIGFLLLSAIFWSSFFTPSFVILSQLLFFYPLEKPFIGYLPLLAQMNVGQNIQPIVLL